MRSGRWFGRLLGPRAEQQSSTLLRNARLAQVRAAKCHACMQIVDSCSLQPSPAGLHRLVFALGLWEGATRPRACSPLNEVQFLVGQVRVNSTSMGYSTPQHCN
jgi:hypothetical protein